jgi:predicted permease
MGIWHDLRHAWRVFIRNPGFTAVAVVSIAFGAGANVAIFSFADALLLRPLPVPQPSEVLTVGYQVKRGLITQSLASYPDYVDIRSRASSFEGLVAFATAPAGFRTRSDEAPAVRFVTAVSHNFFQDLGLELTLGRGFHPDEERLVVEGAVTVLGYGVWQTEFDGSPDVLGRVVRIAGVDCTVVGVAPEDFTGLLSRWLNEAAYVPLALWPRIEPSSIPEPLLRRDARMFNVKGRLVPGHSWASAAAELDGIGADLAVRNPDTNAGQVLRVQTEMDVRFVRNPLDTGLVAVLSLLSMAVLCVACANVGGMLASRAPARAREIAIRLAVGAGRGRLVRQLLIESLGIAMAGCAGGVGVGYAGIALLRQIRVPTEILGSPPIDLDGRSLAISLSIAILCALLFGLGPALQTTRVDLVNTLKAGELAARGPRRLPLRYVLVAVQVALSLVLMTIATYAYQVFRNELLMGPGFRTTHVAKATMNMMHAGRADLDTAAFAGRVLDGIRALPGVQVASATSAMPLFGFELTSIAPEGHDLPEGQTGISVVSASVDEEFFATLAIPILAGRGFLASDRAAAMPVAIVNETLARHYWPDREAVGRRFRLPAISDVWIEVVGVARTTQYWYPGEPPQDAVYFPYRQRPSGAMVLLAGSPGDAGLLLDPIREVVRSLDPDVPVYDAQTIEEFYDLRVVNISTVIIRLIAAMGVMGMVLTMIGLHGLVSYAVGRRTHEIGIRVAMGATALRILSLVLKQGMSPVWVGLAGGLALSLLVERYLPGLVPLRYTFGSGVVLYLVPVLLAVTLAAAFLPARRASRLSPTVALRYD